MVIKIVIVVLYMLGLAAIGIVATKRVKNLGDYFVAGKNLGYWFISFSSRATGESGWLLLGLTGMGYSIGISGFWIVLGEMFGVTVAWVFMTQRFKKLTDKYDSITIPDYLESRFGEAGNALRILSAASLVVFVTAYVAAQFTATGKAFESFFDLDYAWGVIIGLLVVGFYSVAGGFVAVVWSDFVQGLLMLLGLVFMPIVAISHIGGFETLGEELTKIDPSLLDAFGKDGFGMKGILMALGSWAIGLAYLGSPQIFVRFIAIKDVKELPRGALVASFYTALIGAGALLTGMAGRVIVGHLEDPETVLPTLTNELLSPVFVGILVAIVLAAIMSTADSLLVLVSSSVVRDLWQKVMRPDAADETMTRLSRYVTAAIAIIAVVIALQDVPIIFKLVLYAWAGIGSSFCPVIILSIFWKRLSRVGAIAGMVTGFVLTIVWKELVIPNVEALAPVYEMIPAFFGALAVTMIVSVLTEAPKNAEKDLEELKDQVVDLWR